MGAHPPNMFIYTRIKQVSLIAMATGLLWLAGTQTTPALTEQPLELPQAYLVKAFALMEAEQWEEAIAVYRQARSLAPYDGNIYVNLGYIYLHQHKYHLALLTAVRGVELAPHLPAAWTNLGIALYHKERLPEAIQAYEKALLLAPNDINLQQALDFLRQEWQETNPPSESEDSPPEQLARPQRAITVPFMASNVS